MLPERCRQASINFWTRCNQSINRQRARFFSHREDPLLRASDRLGPPFSNSTSSCIRVHSPKKVVDLYAQVHKISGSFGLDECCYFCPKSHHTTSSPFGSIFKKQTGASECQFYSNVPTKEHTQSPDRDASPVLSSNTRLPQSQRSNNSYPPFPKLSHPPTQTPTSNSPSPAPIVPSTTSSDFKVSRKEPVFDLQHDVARPDNPSRTRRESSTPIFKM